MNVKNLLLSIVKRNFFNDHHEQGYIHQTLPFPISSDAARANWYQGLVRDYQNPTSNDRDPIRIIHFIYLIEISNQALSGDYLEIGTFKGDSAKLIYEVMDREKRLYCIDTFEGFIEEDLQNERKVSPNHTWTVGNFEVTSPEFVGKKIGGGKKPDNVILIQGWFPQAYSGLEDRKWRFIHLDMDLYEPTKIALDMLWEKLVPGGVMVFHDYGNHCFPGVKLAVDMFFDALGLQVMQLADQWGSAAIIKKHEPGHMRNKHLNQLFNKSFFNQSGIGSVKIFNIDRGLENGCWYWEIYSENLGNSNEVALTGAIGVISKEHSKFVQIGSGGEGWGWRGDGFKLDCFGNATKFGPQLSQGVVTLQVALDMNLRKIWFGCNGEWMEGGNPASGLNSSFDNLKGKLFPAIGSMHGPAGTGVLKFHVTSDLWRFSAPPGFESIA